MLDLYYLSTGFPKKDAHLSKIKNIPDLFSYKKGKCELSTPNILAIGQVFLLIACESYKLILYLSACNVLHSWPRLEKYLCQQLE